MKAIGKIGISFICLVFSLNLQAQIVTEGKITYERRTNLLKKFDDENMRKMINEKNKIKIENFSLLFNDTASLYAYVQPDEADRMSWMTMKNTVYQNFKQDERMVFMDMWGTQITLADTLYTREWKITDKVRKIAGYNCTRAIWQKNDSTRIHAWFTTDIVPTVGPESVYGLPGAVLGLATEDGGVVIFATKVEVKLPEKEKIELPKKKGKAMTELELRKELEEKLKGQPYGERVISEVFFW